MVNRIMRTGRMVVVVVTVPVWQYGPIYHSLSLPLLLTTPHCNPTTLHYKCQLLTFNFPCAQSILWCQQTDIFLVKDCYLLIFFIFKYIVPTWATIQNLLYFEIDSITKNTFLGPLVRKKKFKKKIMHILLIIQSTHNWTDFTQ